MRILVANVGLTEEDSEEGRQVKNGLVPLWRRNLELVKKEDTKLTFRFASRRPGVDEPAAEMNSDFIYYMVLDAEKEGFDTAMITCWGDPMLRELRQTVNIPVVSIGESSLLVATMMAYKFGVVSVSEFLLDGVRQRIAECGLNERSVGTRAIAESAAQQARGCTDASHVIESFKEVARELIADGAQVIITGCGLLSPPLRLAPGVEEEYPNGVAEVDGIPVVDVLGDTIKMAEMLVALQRAGSYRVNRAGLFPQNTPGINEPVRIPPKDKEIIFWDC
jgi:allantoin racemase